MKRKNLINGFYKELKCRIYVLGGASEGESVLFLLYGDNQVIYSCVTDSFISNGKHIPDIMLEELNIHQLDDVFWSHPHEDHTNGLLELIDKYHPEHIYVPEGIFRSDQFKMDENSCKTLNKLNQYRCYDKRCRYSPSVINVASNYVIKDTEVFAGESSVSFIMYAISPVSERIRRSVVTQSYSRINDFSLVVNIEIGDYVILLTGDVQDDMIKYINQASQYYLYTPNILKIPHHGSRHSLNIISLFNDDEYDHGVKQIGMAVTTIKSSSGLPIPSALEFYSSYCDKLYQMNNNDDVGIWGVEIDITGASMTPIDLRNYILHTHDSQDD